MMQARGITFRFNSPLERVEKTADGAFAVTTAGHAEPLVADAVLVATGRRPKTCGLGLDNAGIVLGAGGEVPVDGFNATSCPSIYAVGDVTDRVQLTPVAIREGHAFADTVFGNTPRTIDYDAIPTAVFSSPPLAGVGLTEEDARRIASRRFQLAREASMIAQTRAEQAQQQRNKLPAHSHLVGVIVRITC